MKNILLFCGFIFMTSAFTLTSCKKDPVKGCTNPLAENYDPDAEEDTGNCIIKGCTNPDAENFNPDANTDDGSCIINGCTDANALDYNPDATTDDGSCTFKKDLFIGVYKGSMECDYELLNEFIGGQDLTFTILEIEGEHDKVTVSVDFELDLLEEEPVGTIGDDQILRFTGATKGIEIDIFGSGTPELVDIYTNGELMLDEETMDILSGTIDFEVQTTQTNPPTTVLVAKCNALANRQ